ncbi:MAG: hypothetical protein WBN75_02985 [Verrucomicrobiia bacterium]
MKISRISPPQENPQAVSLAFLRKNRMASALLSKLLELVLTVRAT